MKNLKYKLISFFIKNPQKHISIKMLIEQLKVAPKDEQSFNDFIIQLKDMKFLKEAINTKLFLNDEQDFVIGKIMKKNNEMLVVSNVNNKNIYFNLMNQTKKTNIIIGDTVLIRRPNKDLLNVCVIEILQRDIKQKIKGTFLKYNDKAIVYPHSDFLNEIDVSQIKHNNINSYDEVDCYIDSNTENIKILRLELTKSCNELLIDKTDELLDEYGIQSEFNYKIKKQLKQLKHEITDDDLSNRLNLTNEMIFTIDAEDAKDLDDAVSIKKYQDYYLLGVHIADVSHYVKENSAIDREALNRGSSIYLVNRVIPMLPKELSNGVCSLTKGQLRLTISVFIKIDFNGDVIDYEINKSYIRSKARLSYKQVALYLENNDYSSIKCNEKLLISLRFMKELSSILREKRFSQGAFKFSCPESKVQLIDNKLNIIPNKKGVANNIIEEFMLVCNEIIARFFYTQNFPCIYRIHEVANVDKIQEFQDSLRNIGLVNEQITYENLKNVLKNYINKDTDNLVNFVLMQSMKKAVYSSICNGHFGLAKKYYCHFTSPIRRYADLMVHRLLKVLLDGNCLNISELNLLEKDTAMISEKISYREQEICEMVRDDLLNYKIEYMKNNKNKSFNAWIFNNTSNNINIILENGIEGVIKSIDNQYYQMGKSVKVTMNTVNTYNKQIIFKCLNNSNSY